MKTVELSIAPTYVTKWGLWEAIREILQNAYDEADRNENCKVDITHSADGDLHITTSTGKLDVKTLLLGVSDKENLRGQFGEGYKLALLVLKRMLYNVDIWTGNEVWTPRFQHSDVFDHEVLAIDIEEVQEARDGVTFRIGRITAEEWEEIQNNLCNVKSYNAIIRDEPGRIYVGGLYVCTLKDFEAGYAFDVKTVKLDRDRGMIDGFNVAWQTSLLWCKEDSTELAKAIKAEWPDVQYCEYHANRTAATGIYGWYSGSYGTAIPVSSKEEIQRVEKAGLRWELVPETLKKILYTVKKWIIPSSASPADRLRAFIKSYESRLSLTI